MVAAWWQRVGISYVLLYLLPWPQVAERWLVVGSGKLLFGLTLTVFPRGSGDTTYNYVEIVVQLALAAMSATAWQTAVRGRPVSPRTRDHVTMLVRYVLGATMLGYGWAKVIPTQMPVPGPDRLLDAVGDMSPMGLLWTFMGASLPYQMLAGLAEAVGGLLLLWRRTTLLGALILTGVLMNVVALNFAYDVPVKLYSSHLLGFALLLVAPHAPRLVALLVLNRPTAPVELRPFPVQRTWVRRMALAAKVVVVMSVAIPPIVTSYQSAQRYGFLSPRHALSGLYRVSAFTRTDGTAVDDGTRRWVRLAVDTSGGSMVLVRADGAKQRVSLIIDPRRGVWTMQTPEEGAVRLGYRVGANGVITLDGTMANDPVQMVLTPEGESLLLGRGFHWINEYPFNR
ncbi:MAG: hypothetical protein ABIT71_06740 [Vicinamibacteraceae bacterium]